MKYLIFFVYIFFIFMLPHTTYAQGPNIKDISNFISSEIPVYLKLKSLEYKNFPDSSAGYGRTSFIGKIELVSNIYVKDSRNAFSKISKSLKEKGFSEYEIFIYVDRKNDEKFYNQLLRKTHSKGLLFNIEGDINYKETVKGFKFSKLAELGIKFEKDSIAVDDENSILSVDSEPYREYIEYVIKRRDKQESFYEDIKNRATNIILNKKFLIKTSNIYLKPYVFNDLIDIEVGSNVRWDRVRYSNIKNTSFNCRVPVRAVFLSDYNGSFDSFFKGNIVNLGFFCRIYKNKKNGKWIIYYGLASGNIKNSMYTFNYSEKGIFPKQEHVKIIEK